MKTIRSVIENLQASGLVIQGLSIEQIEDLLKNDQRPVEEQFAAIMMQGRAYGIYVYQDQVNFDQVEFARKLGEIGFDKDGTQTIMANLRPTPTPELSRLGDRD
ncbi:hypothetical protein [Marinobacter salarius]|uniref:Uncharacterized protein n=1 Tax=Marinobacter salarius TaxID=1420917 RepID=A0A1W6KFE5_9GAMM|nr:hypothetical protein [Marinobacter salarius]ARM86165.1 hypothetical protein MARSALSMR5_04145 [Marinobacter salarius]